MAKKKTATPDDNSAIINNRYDSLDELDVVDHPQSTGTTNGKNVKCIIPSIIVSSNQYDSIKTIFKKISIENVQFKFMTIVVRINLFSLGDYEKVKNELKNKNAKFFTHELPSN